MERAIGFLCEGEWLYGVLHLPPAPGPRGLVIVVGGPQYRVGSHRQFVLLARALAVAGVPVLRFDYRGMGDSEGAERGFERIDADLRTAIDTLCEQTGSVREVVVWGLCDAASAALMYAPRDARVAGLVLLNPWVRSEQGIARTYLRHYYFRRLADAALWRKVARGEFRYRQALRSLYDTFRSASDRGDGNARPYTDRMREGLEQFRGRVLLVLSGDDLTASEFKDFVEASDAWRALVAGPRVTRRDLHAANHTFSRREWRDRVAAWTLEWLRSW